jgi:hypothetical protein
MWVEALMRSFPTRSSINAVLAELQEAREAACPCNQPGYQAPRDERLRLSPEELEARRAELAARVALMAERKRQLALRDRAEYVRPRPPRGELPRDPLPADPNRPNPLSGGTYCRP